MSFRFPRTLLERIKSAAKDLEVPYQTLVKSIVEAGVERLERRSRGGLAIERRARSASKAASKSTRTSATKGGPSKPDL